MTNKYFLKIYIFIILKYFNGCDNLSNLTFKKNSPVLTTWCCPNVIMYVNIGNLVDKIHQNYIMTILNSCAQMHKAA